MARWVYRAVGVALAAALTGVSAAAQGVAVPGLYQGVVATAGREPGSEALAVEALRQVVVRVTGRQSSATEPTLAPVYAEASHYARTFRATATGQTVVDFDAARVDAALGRVGQPLWGRDRWLTSVMVLTQDTRAVWRFTPADAELKRSMEAMAMVRGTPLRWAQAPALEPAVLEALLAGHLDPLLAALGVEAVLVGQAAEGAWRWRWLGPAGSEEVGGSGADAINAMADRYGARAAVIGGSSNGQLIELQGIQSLRAFAQAQAVLNADAAVRTVQVESVAADRVRFRVTLEGERPDFLQSGVAGWQRLESSEGVLRFRVLP